MTQPTPSNPLDKYVYPTSDNFTPSMKPQYIGQIGKGTPLDVVKMKSIPIIKLKVFDKVIDVVEDRRNKRTMLINRKATALERSLNDTLEQNEIEMRYRKQKEQMERLANFFANGILSNLYRNVENKAIQDYQRQYLENDPDIADFDEESKEVLDTAENVVKLQQQNEELEGKVLRLEQDIQNLLKERAMKAETGEEVGQITEDYAEFSRIPKVDPITQLGAGGAGNDDDLLRREEEAQTEYQDDLVKRVTELKELASRVKGETPEQETPEQETPESRRGRPKLTEEEKQQREQERVKNLLTEIGSAVQEIDRLIAEKGVRTTSLIAKRMTEFKQGLFINQRSSYLRVQLNALNKFINLKEPKQEMPQ